MHADHSPFHFFGIRHHGPGCARSLVQALADLQPDCLLVEGPPDAEERLPLMLSAGLVPPVALLVYNPEKAAQAVFYPLATFSPEWNALRHGLMRQIPVRFIDLPAAHRFALEEKEAEKEASPAALTVTAGEDGPASLAVEAEEEIGPAGDPLDWLGRAAGYGDGEAWWNHLVEERGDSLELFAAIREAMCAVRREVPWHSRREQLSRREALREAHMRKCLRQAEREGFQRIAVVCGAWHVPALAEMPAAKADNDCLKGLPKLKVAATWVPWSFHNLSFFSGYGAGVDSPGWYEYLWQHRGGEKSRAVGWLTRAARLFREEGLDCSSAHVIEAVRLAETLAALRERPQPGLDELNEALRTVVCLGDDAPIQLIRRQLIVGDRLGRIPEEAPAVPLQRDLAQQQKRLRLKADAARKILDLDLRQPNDLARSHLLHRLTLLDVDWGRLNQTGKSAKGSFHEVWSLQWEPELALAVIEASGWGNTVHEAASAKAIARARMVTALPELSELIQQALLADLQDAIPPVTQALEDLAAVSGNVEELLAAIPPLASVARYGNVRQTDAGMVERLLDGLVPRAAIGLAGACASLDDEAAEAMRRHLVAAHQAIRLLAHPAHQEVWQRALNSLALLGQGHALVSGLAARLLFDEQAESQESTVRRMSQALSPGTDPGPAAAWLEGFLNQGGLVLLHDLSLWGLVNGWLTALPEDRFHLILPLLRRAFSSFSAPERRQLGERAALPGGEPAVTGAAASPEWNPDRAERVLPLLRQLLGVGVEPGRTGNWP